MSKFIVTRNYENAESYYDNLLHYINLLLKLNIKEPQENSLNSKNQSTINQTTPYETKFSIQNLINYEKSINSDSLIKLWNSLTIPIQYTTHIFIIFILYQISLFCRCF